MRRRVPAWQVEAGRLKGWQTRRRRADVRVAGYDYDAEAARLWATVQELAVRLRVWREIRRCGCLQGPV